MITSKLLAEIFPGTPAKLRDRFVDPLNKYLALYGITTYLRACAFLATGGVETDYLRVLIEYASGAAYEGRGDLGNTIEGDGRRFKGRGFFQTTGRYNYNRVNKTVGAKLGIDFIRHPEKLAEVEIAIESACIFWAENKLDKYADKGDFKALSAVVNCGNPKAKPNHWAKRNELYSICTRRVPKDISFNRTFIGIDYGKPGFDHAAIVTQPVEPPVVPNLPVEPATDDFLTTAFDRNVSSDVVKNAVPTLAVRVWRFIARPLMLLYALLEAGNVAAWLGVVVAVVGVLLLIYLHRNDFKRLFETLKRKFTE